MNKTGHSLDGSLTGMLFGQFQHSMVFKVIFKVHFQCWTSIHSFFHSVSIYWEQDIFPILRTEDTSHFSWSLNYDGIGR